MPSRSRTFRNSGSLEIVEQDCPLDYGVGLPVRRMALVDSSAPPAPDGETYFSETLQRSTPDGRRLKRPKKVPGAGPRVVAFADWSLTPDWLTIHYVATRRDQRGRGHMTSLLDDLIARHGHEAQFLNFGLVVSPSVWRYVEKLKLRREWDGKVRAKLRNPRGNMDERRRRAERRAAAGGSVDDEARLLAERVRAGELTMDRVEAAASLGHPAARMLAPVSLAELPEPHGQWRSFADSFVRQFPLECALLMIDMERAMLHWVRWYTHDTTNPDTEGVDHQRCLDAAHMSMNAGTCPRSGFLPGEITVWNAIYDEMRRALLEGRRPRNDIDIPPDVDDSGGLWGHWDLFNAAWAVEEIADRGLETFAREESSGPHWKKFRETLTLFHAWNDDDHGLPIEGRPAWIAQRLAYLILHPQASAARMNPRANMDEDRRGLERRARSTGAPDDAFRADVAAERSDGQARRVNELVRYAVWRVGEVMRPRDPMAWERARGPVTSKAIASMLLDACRLEDATAARKKPTDRAKRKKPRGAGSEFRGSSITTSVAIEDFQQRRPCVEERHEEPCVYDGCAACEEECIDPEEGGGCPRYRQKVAAAFAFARDQQIALGIKATSTDHWGLIASPRSWVDSSANPFEVVFGHQFDSWPLWATLLGITPSLAQYEEDLFDTDDVRVWDNGGRTADRYTILMQGRPSDEDDNPSYLTITSSRNPTNPQGVWLMSTDASVDVDDDETNGPELDPWTELLPQDVRNAIWEERGRSIVRLSREVAERWARLTLAGYFD